MFKNHLNIAWRTIKKDKLFTFIKIGGFAVGIAACLLIALFIRNEISYDEHYTKKDQIYRVVFQGEVQGEVMKSTHFQLPFADALQSDFPEITKAGKVNTIEIFGAGKRGMRVSGQNENTFEENFILANQEAFDILEIQLDEGNPQTALSRPSSIVMSRSKADKYFPNGDALQQTIFLDNDTSKPYTVTGIMEDVPENSHLDFDFLLPIEDTNQNWTNQNYFTYVLVNPNTDIPALEQKMSLIVEKYIIPAQIKRGRSADFIDVLRTAEYKLQPVTDIYLKSDLKMQDGLKHGDIKFVWLFAAIAIFVLLLAIINFINLSTAKSANRAKEVGLRKTIGAFRNNLVGQFLTESMIFSIISFVLGVGLAWVLLPTFNQIAAKNMELPLSEWWFLPILLVAALLVGVLAGLYPAFYLSAFRPVNVLKGTLSVGSKSGRLRSGLVIFQFTTSVILIIGTLIIYRQMDFIVSKELGYDKERVVVLEGTNILGNKMEAFKEQLEGLSQVKSVTATNYLPIDGGSRNGNTFMVDDQDDGGRGVPAQKWRVDYDYIETLGIQLEKGRNFSKEYAYDSINSIVINSKMASELGLKDPIGKKLDNNSQVFTIIGVIEDFHFKSLKEDISSLSLVIGKDVGAVSIKLEKGNPADALASVEQVWNRTIPNQAMNYTFLEEEFAQMHADVQRMGSIFNSFALFAILVACLGLFALSAFMVEQRRKEISIRRVLGAPFKNIYQLLTLDFLKLIVISIGIAIPIGWYLMNRWLEGFAYHINIGWEIFSLAALIALGVAIVTISYQSIGAALLKPTKGLRTE
ncbi:MAG: ABC transporter permease [Muricauda sp.]|nr:ABC transporter permease [Allomuricauda sp.]MBO6587950.1 ABC transporter permease [Allomuricauda sp.]MBO6617575.1 ABC transporter permease [Allomuricauda sp.]MBO6643414.1 ABC transporter permease [Allomuricauda sp.]MBO6745910.1 ABC transporter permease [Allomuricauda sp.]MBO6828217.1 ABC transporter permease [Allomuricauda sp.]